MATKETISSMTIADLQNELEANGLSTRGNKQELIHRLYTFRRGKPKTPTLATSFSKSPILTSVSTHSAQLDEELVSGLIDEKLSTHFDKLNKQLMLFIGANAQNTHTDVLNLSEEFKEIEENSLADAILKLKRKMKLFGTSIEMIFGEIEQLQTLPDASIEMQSTLRRLNDLETNYSNIIQEIISLIPDDSEVDNEIRMWTKLQQDILHMSRKAENYIDLKQDKDGQRESKSDIPNSHKFCSGVSHLRLPKFTLPVFNGDILEWVPWWDQFKACIHENNALGDRERFNYLLMYVSGAAKRAIEYIEVTSANYARAVEVLQKRYGRNRIVIEHLVDSLLSIEKKEKVNASSLRYLHDIMINRYHTLEAHEPNLKYCHCIIVPILQSKLPMPVRRKWEYELSKLESEEDDNKVTVEYFFNFLRAHVMSEEASEVANAKPRATDERRNVTRGYFHTDRAASSSAISLTTNSEREEVQSLNRTKRTIECAFCGKQHDSSNCYTTQRKSVEERLQIIKEKKLCFNCLLPTGPNHNSSTCKRPGCLIEGCGKKHHVLLHRVLPDTTEKQVKSDNVTAHTGLQTTVVANVDSQERLLPTALAKLHANGKEVDVRILIDSGSDHSYIRTEVAQALNLKTNGPSTKMTIYMHGGQEKTTKVKNVSFQVSSRTNDKRRIELSAWSVNTVCAPFDAVQVDVSRYKHLKGLNLADEFPRDASSIDVLIGADQWGQVMLNGVRKGPASTPFAVNSIFGWLLSGFVDGKLHSETSHKSITNFAVVKIEEDVYKEVNKNLKRFWELESIGITECHDNKEISGEEKHALQQFHSTISYDGERYEVGLPWRTDSPKLTSNYQQALRRMVKVEESLSKDLSKDKMYKEAMGQYLKDGHAREVNSEDEKKQPVFYLPRHPVIREDKTTTKCRVVFDASARNQDGVSLNDCLLPGPALQPNLLSILLRFRLNRIAMMADIKRMFLQIKLALKDQNCHRFLWREDPRGDPKVYCMTRVTFGVVSSPFQAIATVQHHSKANSDTYPTAAKEIQNNMYVDDLLSGTNDVDSAYALHKDLYSLMKSGGFELVKWYTNSKALHELIDPDLRGTATLVQVNSKDEPLKVLGISWNTREDTFKFNQGETLLLSQDDETKRSLISTASKLFDPLGLIGPFTIRTKIMFQDLWSKGIQWDESLDKETKTKWKAWKEELKYLKDLQVPRCPFAMLDDVTEVELHGFCDASTKAYGAVVYGRFKDVNGEVQTHVMLSKSKVAPTKQVTLPRLELLGAVILSRIIKLILTSITTVVNQVRCWTDSQVVIAWIRQPSQKWKVFVANRVQEIHENVPPSQWYFCPGVCNPADLLTRGQSLTSLIDNDTWWNGPEWLSLASHNWPSIVLTVPKPDDLPEPEMTEFFAEKRKTAIAMTNMEVFSLKERYES